MFNVRNDGSRNTVSFASKLASSEAFKILFREGMTLVEEAAAYLDGPGRHESKLLSRSDALSYAAESMRLTTRLMQLASWLLLQRAVNEGEMTQLQAASEKNKVKLTRQDIASSAEVFARLPEQLRDLTTQSLRLQARIVHLDRLLYTKTVDGPEAQARAGIEAQLEKLRAAFQTGGDGKKDRDAFGFGS